ncbi:hypothetical protein BDV96DRAFT_561438 [Lophiotrema nucula]|uniref:AAA+ ATPase domain-containing protein n=1 Tax=Lophiotrema nucula TaxID=690887 RepID=A0A6A5ZSY8_9PLEO|nr:hypothetical protein BDV96DRAFT_561438 [Lophiotrema nucula]
MAPNNSMQAFQKKVDDLQSLIGDVEANGPKTVAEPPTTNGEGIAPSVKASEPDLQEQGSPKNVETTAATANDEEEDEELKTIAEQDFHDITDGEDVDINEYIRHRHSNLRDIKSRIKIAGKRRNQYHQYINIIEERILVLEDAYKALDKRTRKKGQEDDDDEDSKGLKFNLNPQLWADFNKYRDPLSTFHVIDILAEEPEYSMDPQATARRGTALSKLLNIESPEDNNSNVQERSKDEMQDEVSKLIEGIKGIRLPERIRFNSMALQLLLRKHLHHGSRVLPETRYVMLRPYKTLSQFEPEIQGLLEDTLKFIDNIRRTGNIDGEVKEVEPENGVNRRDSSSAEPPWVPIDPGKPLKMNKILWIAVFKGLLLSYSEEAMKHVVNEWSTDVEVRKTFQCLLEFMNQYLKPVTEKIRSRETDKVRFPDLWHLFRSGDEIVTKQFGSNDQDKAMAMRVLRTNGGRRHIHPTTAPSFDSTRLPELEDRIQPVNGVNPFVVHAWYLDFDGSHLTPVRKRVVIQPYVGERNITDLEVHPIKYAPNYMELRASLIARGKRFVRIVQSPTTSYCDCHGEELDTKEELNDKVIVDMKEYDRLHSLPGYTEPDALDMSETSNCPQGLNCTSGPECYHNTAKIVHDQYAEKAAMKAYIDSQTIFQQFSSASQREKLVLEEDDFALCNYRLYAYKLRSRDWVQVHVSSLADASMLDKEKGFERLVLRSGHKHIIKSQVKEHFRKKAMTNSATQDDLDLVRGKGQGLIILLHGAPGVGKTCTAETIAELVHKPLYPITCGDLGSTAIEVEKNLKEHFTLASKWDCVMLLDEADVFLSRRSPKDLNRNSIVSVFLRIMEYYKGLLFLTTNRVGMFDEAFKSRIHISLFYQDFDKKTTVKVWKTFITQTEEALKRKGWTHFEIRQKEIKRFAEEHWTENPDARWNGRQIRNAFHTAIAMAEFDAREKRGERGLAIETPTGMGEGAGDEVKIVLGKKQFESIATTVRDFDRYMIETMGGQDYDVHAKQNQWRALRKAEEPGKKSRRLKKYAESSSEEESSNSSDSEDEIRAKEKSRGRSQGKKGRKSKKGKSKAEKEDSGSSSSSSESDSN